MYKIITTVLDKNRKCYCQCETYFCMKDGTRMDAIIKETLSNTACSSKVSSEVIQEAKEEEMSDDEKSDEGNCFDMFVYE